MPKVISFPHMGNYHVPIEMMLRLMFPGHTIMAAPKITKRTLELGSRYSPDFVCVPFKYNLGNYIESLEQGADILIQAGGGCRYGYYAEIQEEILHELGYEFQFIKLTNDRVNAFRLYKICKEIGTPMSFQRFAYYFLLAIEATKRVDLFEAYMRENIGFERDAGSFEHAQAEFFKALGSIKNFAGLERVYKKYDGELKNLPINKPEDCLKVGLVGELYTLMEPFSNFFMEKELAKNNIAVSRFITLTYLMFQKSKMEKKLLADAGDYLKYAIGADGTDSVANTRMLAKRGYDGIIHVKPFGCTPEVNAMPMLQKIGRDYEIPILYFSFDSQTSETGVKTRLEAFNDMLTMRRGEKLCK